jgi:hypothetical protein
MYVSNGMIGLNHSCMRIVFSIFEILSHRFDVSRSLGMSTKCSQLA